MICDRNRTTAGSLSLFDRTKRQDLVVNLLRTRTLFKL